MENNLRVGKKAWVVAVDMGYGHQRTAYPLRDLAFGGKVINANNYEGIIKKDKRFWQTTKSSYEFISRLRGIPFIAGPQVARAPLSRSSDHPKGPSFLSQ